jgi:LPS export ABC transporter protein LptC
MRIIAVAVSCVVVFIIAAGCGPQKDNIPVGSDAITEPHQAFHEAILHFYEHGIMRWRLDTDYMTRPLADTGSMLVVPVRISVYDTSGDLSARIISDSGRSDPRMEIFDLWGSVYVKNEDGMAVRSEQLKWFKNVRRITSDTYVQIETAKGDVLRGRGLDAMDDFSRFSFKADVRGRFPDFRRRLEQQDEDFFR